MTQKKNGATAPFFFCYLCRLFNALAVKYTAMPNKPNPPNTSTHGKVDASFRLATDGGIVSTSFVKATLVEEEAVRVWREFCCCCSVSV